MFTNHSSSTGNNTAPSHTNIIRHMPVVKVTKSPVNQYHLGRIIDPVVVVVTMVTRCELATDSLKSRDMIRTT